MTPKVLLNAPMMFRLWLKSVKIDSHLKNMKYWFSDSRYSHSCEHTFFFDGVEHTVDMQYWFTPELSSCNLLYVAYTFWWGQKENFIGRLVVSYKVPLNKDYPGLAIKEGMTVKKYYRRELPHMKMDKLIAFEEYVAFLLLTLD